MNVAAVCRTLGMSRQNYYARRRQRQRRAVDEELVVELVRRERRLQPRLGTRKLRVLLRGELKEAGIRLGRDRFFELLGRHDLLLAPVRSDRPSTTSSRHALPVFKNLVREVEPSGPNQVWVSDLTYLRTREGFLYLALITDRWSRKIVGHHCGDTLEVSGCLAALSMALRELPAGARPIHHSDRGSQYCCHEYVKRLGEHGLQVSMTEVDHCAENALAERMNGIVKSEYGLGKEFANKAAVPMAVQQGVSLYNTRRPHTALDYETPEARHRLAESGTRAGPPAGAPCARLKPRAGERQTGSSRRYPG